MHGKVLAMSPGREFLTNHVRQEQALRLQRRADRKTMLRYWAAIPVSALMAVTKPSIATGVVNAYLWDTDRTDGRDAKKARALWPEMKRTKASTFDPPADKRLQYGNRAALFTRACFGKDWETAAVVAGETAVSALRDKRMAAHRSLATAYDIETDATMTNRAKTALIAAGEVVALSPLANKYDTVRRAALATMCVGTLVGVIGAEQYGLHVREEISSRG